MKHLLALVFGTLAITAQADNFRCGSWIARTELAVSELLAKCGEPVKKETRTEEVLARNTAGYTYKTGDVVVIETWTYQRGTRASYGVSGFRLVRSLVHVALYVVSGFAGRRPR